MEGFDLKWLNGGNALDVYLNGVFIAEFDSDTDTPEIVVNMLEDVANLLSVKFRISEPEEDED